MTKFVNKDLDYILPHLRLQGAQKIEIHFDGSGDSGEIVDTVCEGFDLGKKCPGHKEKKSYQDILHSIGYAYLEDVENDWRNNEGGFGKITINLNTRALHCDMHVRITNLEDYEYDNKF